MLATTHRIPYRNRSLSAKSPIISGSVAENDLQLKASYGSPPSCAMQYICVEGNTKAIRRPYTHVYCCVQLTCQGMVSRACILRQYTHDDITCMTCVEGITIAVYTCVLPYTGYLSGNGVMCVLPEY